MNLRWFRFSAPGLKDLHDYATQIDANEYGRKASLGFVASALDDPASANDDGVPFSIRLALSRFTRVKAAGGTLQ